MTLPVHMRAETLSLQTEVAAWLLDERCYYTIWFVVSSRVPAPPSALPVSTIYCIVLNDMNEVRLFEVRGG